MLLKEKNINNILIGFILFIFGLSIRIFAIGRSEVIV